MSGGDWKQMFKAIQENNYELVSYYLRIGIDPNYQHPEYMAHPLAESIRYNDVSIAKLLLENGADPLSHEMETNMSVQKVAIKIGNKEMIDLIDKHLEK